ncbi:MAG: AbrB/MazE/SpoVT family DNA-binding domain-containing protein [Acidobacteria bacterium]|jgi:AbrB family looped-hinge helix DNA binding protein|nr:AbrB/MazE/SpoVT family DNA-binding domain-containing protein [Acidobacteriota bacterium]
MENIDFTRLSSKGQIVVPRRIRERLRLANGDLFLIFGSDDTLVLKRMEGPSLAEFNGILASARKSAKKAALTRQDLEKAIQAVRHNKRKK